MYELKSLSCPVGQPSGDFYPSDILADRMMGTGLCNQYPIPWPEAVNGLCAVDKLAQFSLVSCKEY